jgi:hypothetical protein
MAQRVLFVQFLLIIEASRSHSDTPHSVGLLWTSDQPNAETSIWQHTTLFAPGGIRTHNPSTPAAADPRPRPRGHQNYKRVVAFMDITTDTVHRPTYTKWSRYLIQILYLHLCLYLHAAGVLLKKPTIAQLVEKFPAFHGTQKFITAFTTARVLPLSWTRLTIWRLTAILMVAPHR